LTTLFVGAAALLYVLWATDTAFTGISTRVLAAVVLVLGFTSCAAGAQKIETSGRGDQRVYQVITSLLGFVALVAGVSALITGSEAVLAVLVVAIVLLWATATIRHAMIRGGKADAGTAGPSERAARL